MAEINSGNWCFQDPGDDIPSGSTIHSGNFMQLVPDTPILVGKTLVINSGNWINVRQDPAWTILGGNWAQISRCAHLHPEWSLPAESENCVHVIETYTIQPGSVDVYEYKDTVL